MFHKLAISPKVLSSPMFEGMASFAVRNSNYAPDDQ